MNKNILVFGATGKTGLQIVESLKLANLEFALFVREQSIEKLGKHQYELLHGDVMDSQAVNKVIRAQDFSDIIISLGSQALKATGIRAEGTRNIIAALLSNHKSARIHVVSALGVGESINQIKWYNKLLIKLLLKNVMLDHEAQEKIVRESALPYHIVRPVGLKDGDGLGKVHVQEQGFLPRDTIKRADVAQYLVDSLVADKEGFSNICQGA